MKLVWDAHTETLAIFFRFFAVVLLYGFLL